MEFDKSSNIFIQGGGQTGEVVRNFDWENSDLGKPDLWPISLKTSVGQVLHSDFPMIIMWGADLICIYNDAVKKSLADKHPAIGKKASEIWSEAWDIVGPLLKSVMQTGEPIRFEDQLIPFYRNGSMENTYWTFSYGPAFGDNGQIAGILVVCNETTEKVLSIKDLNESRDQLRFAIDVAQLGTWEFNLVTFKFKGNERLKDWFGLTEDSEIELSMATEVIVDRDKERVAQAAAYAVTYESNGIYDIEYTIKHPITGVERMVRAHGKAYFDENKMPFIFNGTLQDVTEEANIKKRLAEEVIEQTLIRAKVEQSEAHLNLLRDTVPANIYYLDADQRYQSYNNVFKEWFNVDDAEAIGKTTREFIGENAYQEILPFLDKAYSGERTDFEILSPSGINNGKWLRVVYTPHISPEGLVIGIIVHATDITQSKFIEQSLRESELFLHDIFYNSPVANAAFTGIEMTVARINENMLDLLGRDESIIGKPFEEAVPEIRNTKINERMREVFRTGQTFTMPEEKIELIRYGKPYTGYYSYIYKPLISALGKIYGVICTATEITGQVLSRKTIEVKEKEWRDLIEASPIGICVVSCDPVRVEQVNDRFLLITGKTREQYEKAPYWEVLAETADTFRPILAEVFKTGLKYTTKEHEVILVRDSVPETLFLTLEYIPVLDSEKHVIRVIVMAMEVTHQVEIRKKIEDAVVERTRELAESNLSLKNSNADLEQFAYIASHDLQEPIRKISTFTQMLELSLPDISDKSKDYFTKINSSTERMTNLIRDVLAFSSVEHTNDKFVLVNLVDILNDVIKDFELQIETTGATINVKDLPIVVASPLQMNQLLANLLSNSLKYIKPGLKPIINVSSYIAVKEKVAKHPTLDINKRYHHIKFSDNGIGFDTEYVDKIFKIFQRLHGKTEFEGTGIGLSICKKIIQTHGGHISAIRGENGGAEFNILLPAL